MTIQEQIDALLAKAAPLRLLPDDEAEAAHLPQIVESINELRARQARGVTEAAPYYIVPDDTPALPYPPEPVKRGPGRPKKDEAA